MIVFNVKSWSICFLIISFYGCSLDTDNYLDGDFKVMTTKSELISLEEIVRRKNSRMFLFIPPVYCKECFDFSLIELGEGENMEIKKEIILVGCFSSVREFLVFEQINKLSNAIYYIQDCDDFAFFHAITLFEVDEDLNIIRDVYLDYLDPDCVDKFLLNN